MLIRINEECFDQLSHVVRSADAKVQELKVATNEFDLNFQGLRPCAALNSAASLVFKGLSGEIRARGEKPTESGYWAGDFNKMYGDISAMLGTDEYAYVEQLEESEDRMVKEFEKAINDKGTTPNAHIVLMRLLPEVRQCHDLMRNRKAALKKAA